jgi:ABC-2 type transport system permease protein
MLMVVSRRETLALFRAPLAWCLLAAAQGLVAYQFLAQIALFQQYLPRIRGMAQPPGVAQFVVVPTVHLTALLLLFAVPVLTMQTLSGERRSGTLRLWYSAPVSLTALVLGKYLGVMSLLGTIWIMNALMPLTLLWGTTLDTGTCAGALLALALLAATAAAFGICSSALSAQPAVAALLSFAILLALWLIDWNSDGAPEPGLLAGISMMTHFQRLASGLVDSFDVAYFMILTAGALALAVWALTGERRAL